MADAFTLPLSPSHRWICDHCGALVWAYPMQSGATAALDSSPGEFIIDARNHAYRSVGLGGFAQHLCHVARAHVARPVLPDEFLWR